MNRSDHQPPVVWSRFLREAERRGHDPRQNPALMIFLKEEPGAYYLHGPKLYWDEDTGDGHFSNCSQDELWERRDDLGECVGQAGRDTIPLGPWPLTPTERDMPDNMTRRNVYLPDHLWEHAGRDGSAAERVRTLLERDLRLTREAHDLLEAQGWKENEKNAVYDTLNGTLVQLALPLTVQISADMEDSPDLAAKWGIPADRWQALTEQAQEERTALALWIATADFWQTT